MVQGQRPLRHTGATTTRLAFVVAVALALALAGCSGESLTKKITRECDEAAQIYFAAHGFDKLIKPYYVDPAAAAAWEKQKPPRLEGPATREDQIANALAYVGWLENQPPARKPTQAEAAEHERRQQEYNAQQVREWARKCRTARATQMWGR